MIFIRDFGLAEYEPIWADQKQVLDSVAQGQVPPTVFVGEHPHVYTTGRGFHAENLLRNDVPLVEIERGGDITYHGPGQLIAYPILPLPPHYRDLHRYLRDLEQVLIDTLAEFQVEGLRNPGCTGVWVKDAANGQLMKMASIGVAVKKWVTYHGIALNVTTDLSYYQAINPCGLASNLMTRLVDQAGHSSLDVQSIKPLLIHHLEKTFGHLSREAKGLDTGDERVQLAQS